MSTTILPEDLKLDRSRFPYSLKYRGKVIATIYSNSLVDPLRAIAISTHEINRLIREKTRLLDWIQSHLGDISDIEPEVSLSFILDDVVSASIVIDNRIEAGSRWESSKKKDLYEIKMINSKKGTVLLSWLGGHYTREVTFASLTKSYKPVNEVVDDLGGPDVDEEE